MASLLIWKNGGESFQEFTEINFRLGMLKALRERNAFTNPPDINQTIQAWINVASQFAKNFSEPRLIEKALIYAMQRCFDESRGTEGLEHATVEQLLKCLNLRSISDWWFNYDPLQRVTKQFLRDCSKRYNYMGLNAAPYLTSMRLQKTPRHWSALVIRANLRDEFQPYSTALVLKLLRPYINKPLSRLWGVVTSSPDTAALDKKVRAYVGLKVIRGEFDQKKPRRRKVRKSKTS